MAESQSIQTASSAPIFGPDGEVHLIPNQQIPDALANQGELAVPMRNPATNELHYVRKSEVPAAMQAGGKVDFSGVPQAHKDGFLGALGSDLGGMAKGLVTSLPPVAAVQAVRQGIDNVDSLRETGKTVQQREYDQRRAEGYNPVYSALAPAAQAAGLNVPGMEQAAREGDTGAVVGHAAAPVVAAAATAGAMKYGPRAASSALDAVKTSAPVEALSEVRQALTAPQNLEAGEAAVKAVRPRNSIVDAKAKIETALPDARRAADTLGLDPAKMTLEDAESAVTQAKKDVWGEFEGRFLGPNRRIGLDTTPVADRINAVADNMTDIQKRRLGTDKITDAASDYDGKIHSLDQVETRIQELNNTLRSQQAQFKVNEMALRRDPAYAHQFAELDGLRQIEAEAFDQLSGEGAPELKQRYGALKVLEDTLQRRANVAERQNPVSLPQAMGRMRGLGKVAKGVATFSPGDVIEGLVNLKAGENARLYNDPDFLIQQAFSKTQPSPAPLAPNPRPIAGLLPRGPMITPQPEEAASPAGSPSFYGEPTTRAERKGLLLPAAPETVTSAPLDNAQSRSNIPRSRIAYEQAAKSGAAGAVAAVSEPLRPGTEPARGAETQVRVPGEDRAYQARYQVRELEDVQASHSGINFQPNQKYALTNDRDYANPVNQGKVITNSAPGRFDPSYHLTDNPDATNGPIVVDSEGHALGGNGRTMILERVYRYNQDGAKAYRMMLEQKASQFGIDPAQIAKMKRPVLVREIADSEFEQPTGKQTAITDFNKKGTADMTPSERAIADSRRVSQETLDNVAGQFEAAGKDATMADVLRGDYGTRLLDKLITDGVISPQERASLANAEQLTGAGKERISKLMVGRYFRDATQLDATAPSVVGKIERIAAPLARVDGIQGWDLTPKIQEALALVEDARTHGVTVEDTIRQQGLFGESKFSPDAVALAKHLQNTSGLALTKAVRQYAQDAMDSMRPLLGQGLPPEDAFREAFGRRAQ